MAEPTFSHGMIEALSPEEFAAWLDGLDFSDGWVKLNRVKTGKGAYVVRVEPLSVDGKPLVFVGDGKVQA